jgi:hypothetical protein
MRYFKETLTKDIDRVFLNLKEFAETVTLDGESVAAIVDYDELEFPDESDDRMGVVYDAVSLRVRKCDLKGKYQPGLVVTFNGEKWRVLSCNGMELTVLKLYKERS